MSIQNLIHTFDQVKGRKPATADELLDFIQVNYLQGSLSLNEYQTYFKELHAQGAKKPEYFTHEEMEAF
ncbi:YppF family protein [Bacillus sp. RAR_GA_16]|uniref:YppF family protein n=1 Tax=Bacillus sp. RAR_GA_16 TaxID=2876774 RepID=UPI001CCBBDD4|nr:YppF family protein [Bacillus sp. RAR_GA_16]MCA0171976.1 YppF family protein [Bacillus sp. RAR_GA_16]